ncbi:MAG: ABC transporter substrate-binding protein [Mesorhizobium sp.]
MRKLTASLAALVALAASGAAAQEIRVGLAAEPTSSDPHYHAHATNVTLRWHVFDGLTTSAVDLTPEPSLAESWTTVDDTTWQFKLRPDVKFSNGSPFTSRDVLYSFCRVPAVEGSPGGFNWGLNTVVGVDTPDDQTVVIKTSVPDPTLPTKLANVAIVSASVSGAAETLTYAKPNCGDIGGNPKHTEFANPEIAIGTGPFKYAEYKGGERIVMERNENYWGPEQFWKKITFRSITNPGSRVAALLSGDVDVIESPQPQDFERIRSSGFTIDEALSTRSIYIGLDMHEAPDWKSPGITLDKNPLLDKRVRQALSKAINRQAIVERIMDGSSLATGELAAWPILGTTQDLPVPQQDLDGAKQLLAEAGYPDGFDLVLGTSNDRYLNDEKVFQAIAQMWTRAGVRTKLDSQSATTYFTRRDREFAFSAALGSWAASTGEIGNFLYATSLTRDPSVGAGITNFGRYSNAEFDALVQKGLTTMDREERGKIYQQAVKKLIEEDAAVIPLMVEKSPWAFRSNIAFVPRSDQYTVITGTSEK